MHNNSRKTLSEPRILHKIYKSEYNTQIIDIHTIQYMRENDPTMFFY